MRGLLMSEQLHLTDPPLPPLLTVTLAALEVAAGRPVSVLSPARVYQCSRGRWWLDVVVNGRAHFALLNRADLEVAAADLYHQVHGAAPITRPGDR